MIFRARQFLIDHFQTPQNAIVRLESYGMPAPQLEAARKWFQRNSIPSDYLPLLLAVVEMERGRPVSVVGYMTQERVGDA